jgi:hypothetical protein
MLMAKEEEVVLQRLIEIGKRRRMEMSVKRDGMMRISRRPSPVQILIVQNSWRMWSISTICVAH